MPTRPWDLVPLEPIFYVVKFGFAGIYKNYFSKFCSYHRLWILVSLESPQKKRKKNMTSFYLKTVILQRLNRNILPRRVSIICQSCYPCQTHMKTVLMLHFSKGAVLKIHRAPVDHDSPDESWRPLST